MTKYGLIRQIANEMGGRIELELLAKKVLERGVYQEEDFSGCKMQWLRMQCRHAVGEEDPDTGLDSFLFVRQKGLKTQKKRIDDANGVYVQPPLLDWDEWCVVVDERVQSMEHDNSKLQRMLDLIFEAFGKLPPVPEWLLRNK